MSDVPLGDATTETVDAPPVAPAPESSVRTGLRMLARTKIGLAISSTLAVFFVYALFLLLLTQFASPRLLSTLAAVSEKVVVRVGNPDQSAFFVGSARMSVGDATTPTCVNGLLARPMAQSTVSYARIGNGNIFIEVAPPFEREGDISLTLVRSAPGTAEGVSNEQMRGYVTFEVPAERPDKEATVDPMACPNVDPIVRLPIYGTLSLGEEQQAPSRPVSLAPGLLHSGSLEVSARAIVLMGFMRPTTYPVATISIPVGSRFEAKKASSEDGAFWWGFVGARKDQPALSVAAATEASAFSIYRPGLSEPVEVEVGVLAQVFNDPNLARVQVLVAVFLLILNLAISIIGIAPWGGHGRSARPRGWRNGRHRENKTGEP